ncbi:imidazole glycerol phosphate synthase subunit HisH [Nostocales cyanobacterium HT-58-2]|nr:imidazole glycerol phosphate synthase subunit HisH [Nostocales cyanobacterium HT-58-2]
MNSVSIGVIYYDMGNLHSACKALERVGAQVSVVARPSDIHCYDGLVLLGVGAFDLALRKIREYGFEEPIKAAIANRQPLLGICLGLQILFDHKDDCKEPGLGIVPGTVQRFISQPGLTIPHLGWNQLQLTRDIILWRNISPNPWVYFAHSYYVVPTDPSWIAGTVTHGSHVVTAAISQGTLMGTQFHPEKSSQAGLQVLANFVQFVSNHKLNKAEFDVKLTIG